MAENFTSQGLFGLSHFRSSRAAQELFRQRRYRSDSCRIAWHGLQGRLRWQEDRQAGAKDASGEVLAPGV